MTEIFQNTENKETRTNTNEHARKPPSEQQYTFGMATKQRKEKTSNN